MCYVAGAFDGDISDTVWFVHGNSTAQPDPAYTPAMQRKLIHVRGCTLEM